MTVSPHRGSSLVFAAAMWALLVAPLFGADPKAPEGGKTAGAAGHEVTLAEGKLVVIAPKSWVRKEPKVRIVEHEFAIPSGKGDNADGRFTVMGAGGTVDANITRWIGQFVQSDGTPTKDKAKIDKRKVAGIEVHVVDVSGDFKDQAGPFAPAVMKPDYRMLAAIIVTEKLGQHFLKFYGPKEVVAANEKAFDDMINSLQKK